MNNPFSPGQIDNHILNISRQNYCEECGKPILEDQQVCNSCARSEAQAEEEGVS